MTLRSRPRRATGVALAALIFSLLAPPVAARGVAERVSEPSGIGRTCGIGYPTAGASCRPAALATSAPLGEAVTSLWSQVVEVPGPERTGTDPFGEGDVAAPAGSAGRAALDGPTALALRYQRAPATGRAPRPPPIAS